MNAVVGNTSLKYGSCGARRSLYVVTRGNKRVAAGAALLLSPGGLPLEPHPFECHNDSGTQGLSYSQSSAVNRAG